MINYHANNPNFKKESFAVLLAIHLIHQITFWTRFAVLLDQSQRGVVLFISMVGQNCHFKKTYLSFIASNEIYSSGLTSFFHILLQFFLSDINGRRTDISPTQPFLLTSSKESANLKIAPGHLCFKDINSVGELIWFIFKSSLVDLIDWWLFSWLVGTPFPP